MEKTSFIWMKSRPKYMKWLWMFLFVLLGLIILTFILWRPVLGLYYQISAGQLMKRAVATSELSESSFACIGPTTIKGAERTTLEKSTSQLLLSYRFWPSAAQTSLLLGRAYCRLGQYSNAISAYQRYVNLRPQNPLGLTEIGIAYGALNNWERAFQEWKSAGISASDLIEVGNQAQQQGDVKGAELWFKRAAQYDPSNQAVWDAWVDLGVKLEQGQRWSEALDVYQSAVNFQGPTQVHRNSAKFFLRMGIIQQWYLNPAKVEQALKSYQAAIADGGLSNPSDEADLHQNIGFILWWQRPATKPESYIQEFEKVLSLVPNHYWAHLMLGQAHLEDFQDLEKAKSYIVEAINLQPDNPWGYLFLGDIYLKGAQPELARQSYDKALALKPDFQEAQDRLKTMEGSQIH
jgi:tetratricopeptide (TPR) repeat protein